jgi:hypothetical protein
MENATVLVHSKVKVKVMLLRQSVGQSVLVSGTHLGPVTNFFPFLFDYFLDIFGFVDVGCPLWREVGSVVFSFFRASPAQPFSDLSPTRLMSIVYCLHFWDSPNLEGQVPVFISPRNRVAQLYPRALGFSPLCNIYWHVKCRHKCSRGCATWREKEVCSLYRQMAKWQAVVLLRQAPQALYTWLYSHIWFCILQSRLVWLNTEKCETKTFNAYQIVQTCGEMPLYFC